MIAVLFAGLLLAQEPEVDALLKRLSDDSIEVRDQAIAALIELDAKAEEGVKKLLATAEADLKARCEAILRAMKSNRKLSEVLPPLRRVTIDAKDAALIDVLLDLQRQTGMAMRLDGMIDAKVSVKTKEAAPLEALDAVCKAAGIGFAIDRELNGVPQAAAPGANLVERGRPSIRFQPGYSGTPRLFVRHYSIAATNLAVHKWSEAKDAPPTATLNLRLSWTPETRPESGQIEVASVTDDQGRSIFTPAPGAVRTGQLQSHIDQPLRLTIPEGGAKSIASVRGKARLVFLKDEKSVVFDKVLERIGTREERGGLAVELQDVQAAGATVKVTLAVTGQRPSPPDEAGSLLRHVNNRHFRLKLADGTEASLFETRHCRTGALTTVEVTYRNVNSKAASLEVTVESSYFHDSFDFELKNIPFPK